MINKYYKIHKSFIVTPITIYHPFFYSNLVTKENNSNLNSHKDNRDNKIDDLNLYRDEIININKNKIQLSPK